jgi:hypothetical protein
LTRYFVDGISGSDSNNGTTAALAKATFTGAESLALVGDDEVQVRGPFTYRETHATAHAGSSGHPITFIADVSGTYFPTGGKVILCGSDNDQAATRTNCINSTHSYRTWQGFIICSAVTQNVLLTNVTNNILQDCVIASQIIGINVTGASQSSHTFRRCILMPSKNDSIIIQHSATVDNAAHNLENLLFLGSTQRGVNTTRVGGITVNACTMFGILQAVRVVIALSVGQTLTVKNSIITACTTALQGTVLGELVEDFNTLFGNTTDRSTVNVGANSNSFLPGLDAVILSMGFPTWMIGYLQATSPLAAIAGSGLPADDLFRVTRPGTPSRGAIQYIAGQRPFDSGIPRNN